MSTWINQLGEAVMASAGRAPCQGCPELMRCAEGQLACQDFRYYVIHGELPQFAPEDLEQLPPRAPTAEMYNLIYNGDDNGDEDQT